MIARLAPGLLLSLCSCLPGPPKASCVLDDDCGSASACFEGSCSLGFHQDGGLAWCPKLAPRLSDLDQRLFKVSCGSKTNFCHNAQAASDTSGLDLSGGVFTVIRILRDILIKVLCSTG